MKKIIWIIGCLLISAAAYWGIYQITSPLIDRQNAAEDKVLIFHYKSFPENVYLEKQLAEIEFERSGVIDSFKKTVPLTIVLFLWLIAAIIKFIITYRSLNREIKRSEELLKSRGG